MVAAQSVFGCVFSSIIVSVISGADVLSDVCVGFILTVRQWSECYSFRRLRTVVATAANVSDGRLMLLVARNGTAISIP